LKTRPRNSTPKPRQRTHTPTPEKRKLVHDLAAMGTRHEDICDLLDIGSINTLKNHYSEELKKGRVAATAKVAQALYKKALEGDTACMIFWMKTQGGWRETDRMDVNVKGAMTKSFVFKILKPGEDFPIVDAEAEKEALE